MSVWRDIWRYGIIANRIYSENKADGEQAYNKLYEVYGNDGMIHYSLAEALEFSGKKEAALLEYKAAKSMFPVPHWKNVAEDSFLRLQHLKSPEVYFNIKDFNELLWCSYQKVYSFVYLNDFVRYISLSALARGSSEWSLSLIDFRTVMELEIKLCFSKEIKEFLNEERYSLKDIIYKLQSYKILPNKIINGLDSDCFNAIRKAGNIATHEPDKIYTSPEYKKLILKSFIFVLEFFNTFCKEHLVKNSIEKENPLCQLDIKDFIEKLNEEEKLRNSAKN